MTPSKAVQVTTDHWARMEMMSCVEVMAPINSMVVREATSCLATS
jgi:hypothetical protein